MLELGLRHKHFKTKILSVGPLHCIINAFTILNRNVNEYVIRMFWYIQLLHIKGMHVYVCIDVYAYICLAQWMT